MALELQLASVDHSGAASRSAPDSSLVFLSLHGEIFKAIETAAKKNLPPVQAQSFSQATQLVASLHDVGLGVTNIPGGALFPAVYLVANSEDSGNLKNTVKGLLQAQTTANKLPVMPWQSKEIGGANVDFTSSPLGIGAYITEKDGKVLIGTTEGVIKDTLGAGGSDSPLLKTLPGDAKQFITDNNPLVLVFVSMKGIGEMLEGLQDQLAMFTGGQNNFDAAQIEQLKNSGRMVASVGVGESGLQMRSVHVQ